MKRSTLALFVALGLFALLWVQVSAQAGTPRRPIVRTDRDANLLFQDTFDDPASGWDTTASLAGAIIYQDGALAIISQREGDLMWSQLSRTFTDTLIAVDAVQVSDPAYQNNAHGVACRVQPDGISAYTVLVSGAGAFAIVHTGANQDGTLVDWTTSDAIHTGGESNHIALTCAGNTIGLSINGVEVANVADDTLEAGEIALLANSFDDNPVEVHFDNLEVSAVEARPAAAARSLSIRPPVMAEASPLQEAEVVTISQELATGILFRDDFGDQDAVWTISNDDNRSKYYENDEYVMEVKAEEWATWSWGTADPFLNFTVKTNVRMVDGPETARYGVFVRQVDNNNYLFVLIDPRGYYKISRKQDGYWKAIPDSQKVFSSAILTGTATNRLKVIGEGEEVALFVNGQHLTTIRDDLPAAGRAGLVVETTSLPEPPAKVAFDNFLIATPEAFPPVEETGEPGVLYSHDFNTQEDWTESFDDSRDRYYEDDEFVMHIKEPGYLAWAWGLGNTRFDDFTLEADMRAVEGAPEGSYGLFFRQLDNDNFYYLRLNGKGEYSLRKRVEGEYYPVGTEGWTASPHILTGGEANRLRVTAVGPLLALYANGQRLTTAVDDALTLGRAGIIVRSPNESSPFTAAFDNILITEPVPDETALTLEPRPNGDLLFEDDFDEGTGGAEALFGEEWITFAYENGLGRVSTTGSGVRPVMYEVQEFGDFYAEFEFRDGSPEQPVRYGIVLRGEAPEGGLDHYYLVAVRPSDDRLGLTPFADGKWAASHWFDLPENLLKTNELNHVRVEMIGGLVTIFVNEHFVGVATDDTIGESGYIGLAISAGSDKEKDAEVIGYFDNLRVYAPAETESPQRSEATPGPTAAVVQESAQATTAGQALAVVSSPALNVRSGPGVNYGRVGTVQQGDELPVTGRNANCTWLHVETTDGVGWLSKGYITLKQECNPLPVVEVAAPAATPVPTKQPEAQAAAAATSVPAATVQAAAPGLLTGFEQFGTWRRGDEAWGEFARSDGQVKSGNWAGKITYDFPADVADDKNYVVFMRSIPIPGQPAALTMQVYGDGSGNFLNVWVKDAAGQLWQFAFGRIYHTGWKQMTAPLNPNLDWPVQPIGGTATKLTYPLNLQALVLDYPTSEAQAGAIYVDELTAK